MLWYVCVFVCVCCVHIVRGGVCVFGSFTGGVCYKCELCMLWYVCVFVCALCVHIVRGGVCVW